MTAKTRTYLKHAVDARRRLLLADDDSPKCKGCGTDYDCYTDKCGACWDRRRRHRQRAA